MSTVALSDAAPRRQGARWIIFADRVIGLLVDVPAALLVVAEIVVLFTGVLARYVFNAPLIWSDELASILFLWLAMLGSVVALRRNEHMRMTALVVRAKPSTRAFLDVLAMAVPLAFLAMMILPGFEFAQDEGFISTPALDISGAWGAAAFPVGAVLMLLVALLRLATVGSLRMVAAGIGALVAIGAVLYAAQPLLHQLGNLNLLIFFVGLVGAMVLAGVPIAFSFGLATYGYLTLTTSVPDQVLVGRMNEGMSQLILLAVPLFVILGLLMEMTGIARALVGFLVSLLGHVRGGLSYVLIGAMYLVSGISGSKAADMAAIAPVLFPEMRQRGAEQGELLALLAATGAQTETIPPSLVLITIGSVTGGSIAALFTGGLLPGLVLGLVLCAVMRWRMRGKPSDATHRRASWKEIGRALLVALPGLLLPFVIRYAVISGATTRYDTTAGITASATLGLLS